MSNTATAFETDQFAYDVASQSLVKVVTPATGTIGEQEPAMRDLITRSAMNQACGFGPETSTLDVRYVGVDERDKVYRMPVTRITAAPVSAIVRCTRASGVTDAVDSDLHDIDG